MPQAMEELAMSASSHEFNENLRKVFRMSREMLALADEGDRDRVDDSCGILYGVLRDMAYKLRALAEQECDAHRRSGKWD